MEQKMSQFITAFTDTNAVSPYFRKAKVKSTGAVIYYAEPDNKGNLTGRYEVKAFYPNALMSYYSGSFKNAEEMNQKIQELIENQQAIYNAFVTSDSSKADHDIAIGDIFYTSWGYEQTNVDFYQVIGFSGKSTLKLMRVHSQMVKSGSMCGYVVPRPNCFFSDELLVKRITKFNTFSVSSYATANLLEHDKLSDGSKVYKSQYVSCYA